MLIRIYSNVFKYTSLILSLILINIYIYLYIYINIDNICIYNYIFIEVLKSGTGKYVSTCECVEECQFQNIYILKRKVSPSVFLPG